MNDVCAISEIKRMCFVFLREFGSNCTPDSSFSDLPFQTQGDLNKKKYIFNMNPKKRYLTI